jgi:hypothetical protein
MGGAIAATHSRKFLVMNTYANDHPARIVIPSEYRERGNSLMQSGADAILAVAALPPIAAARARVLASPRSQ